MELVLITKHITSFNVHYLFRSIEESIGPFFASTCASAYAPLRIPNITKLIASLQWLLTYFARHEYIYSFYAFTSHAEYIKRLVL